MTSVHLQSNNLFRINTRMTSLSEKSNFFFWGVRIAYFNIFPIHLKLTENYTSQPPFTSKSYSDKEDIFKQKIQLFLFLGQDIIFPMCVKLTKKDKVNHNLPVKAIPKSFTWTDSFSTDKISSSCKETILYRYIQTI